jgi:CheY-like chemotaxis protein
MDSRSPVLHGFDATPPICGHERITGHRIPLVAMTANAMSGDRESYPAAGRDDYLFVVKAPGASGALQPNDNWKRTRLEFSSAAR